ncbi:DegT/DnrJ/EryC1/StrS family aminotransferase [Candidatus Woesearchaeota archaeon]|jgi:perosamine synthetase|nr:DegT/DnrJ/EryC1/StrS family aminotransferase [Candidatus Woesearchaeota archaeon]MBT5273109.1 DegT/DnrJ/EryC1/StrS family aminotransferase [Candidatus Woesearchaeota archaeon]MBT6040789.1 DegT/DnrJ/EryC1/StrS family aminotransferase [Candidatus Woesearchaeota archaeon]MBT6337576.1 DegT/DnrJ/EryC1/StrS family aminotransferase [Candidatus Woesearchaeota archaeon]MBT7927023.1 DegT/DnrJ/EryC1/StrS family aminotransferase [Candidatus Woesearchaeota archaeon]
MNLKIPIAKPTLKGNELKYVTECIETGWISSAGKFVEKFEEKFADFCNVKHGVSCSNGTVAIHLALMALGIGKGDEVIIPDYTFAATANAVLYTGAKPILVDVEEDTWCMDPKLIKDKITPNTKAIIPVHIYGHPCDMDKIMKIAKENKLFVIEDCAEAHGAEYKGGKVGGIGDIGCFSFYGNKIITTGEGGMCITNDKKLANKMRVLKNHGMDESKRYWHEIIGYNYRITNLQAAVGLAQLEQINEFIEKRIKIAELYNKHLKDIKGITLPPKKEWAKNVYWMYCILIKDEFPISRDELIEKLKEKGIDSRKFFFPLSMMTPYKDDSASPVSKLLSNKGICLPTFTDMSEEEIKEIIESVKEVSN